MMKLLKKYKIEHLKVTLLDPQSYTAKTLKDASFVIWHKSTELRRVSPLSTQGRDTNFMSNIKLACVRPVSQSDVYAAATAKLVSSVATRISGKEVVPATFFVSSMAQQLGINPADLYVVSSYYASPAFVTLEEETEEHFQLRQEVLKKYAAVLAKWKQILSVTSATKKKIGLACAKVEDLESLLKGLTNAGIKPEETVYKKIEKQLAIANAKLKAALEIPGAEHYAKPLRLSALVEKRSTRSKSNNQ